MVFRVWGEVARLEGFEPPTRGLEGRCSIQLSYRRDWRSGLGVLEGVLVGEVAPGHPVLFVVLGEGADPGAEGDAEVGAVLPAVLGVVFGEVAEGEAEGEAVEVVLEVAADFLEVGPFEVVAGVGGPVDGVAEVVDEAAVEDGVAEGVGPVVVVEVVVAAEVAGVEGDGLEAEPGVEVEEGEGAVLGVVLDVGGEDDVGAGLEGGVEAEEAEAGLFLDAGGGAGDVVAAGLLTVGPADPVVLGLEDPDAVEVGGEEVGEGVGGGVAALEGGSGARRSGGWG